MMKNKVFEISHIEDIIEMMYPNKNSHWAEKARNELQRKGKLKRSQASKKYYFVKKNKYGSYSVCLTSEKEYNFIQLERFLR